MAELSSKVKYPQKRRGLLMENAAAGAADGIFTIDQAGTKYERVLTGELSAENCAVFADGNDQTAALNTALLNANVNLIAFNNPKGQNSYTVNGVVNGQGKVLRFAAGCKITGNGTINNAIIDAPYNAQIFDTTISLTNCKTATEYFSVNWFGAGTGGLVHAQIQKAIDTIIANNSLTRNLYFVPGTTYAIGSPLIVQKYSGVAYQFTSVNFIGQDAAHFTTTVEAAKIDATAITDTFAIGLHHVRSCIVKGLYIIGAFNRAVWTGGNFYLEPYSTFATGGGVRDNQYSPYTGIAIDPFRNDNTLADLNKYPGLFAYYRGDGSAGGSSGVQISDCRIQGFTVGISYSCNGKTLNAENCLIDSCSIDVCKCAIAYGQVQTKDNFIRNTIHWDRCHTVIDSITYGQGVGQCAYIDGMNVAGTVNRVFNVGNQQFPVTFSNIFCETIKTIGTLIGGAGCITVSDCNFDFINNGIVPDFHIIGYNVDFKNCTIRNYDDLFNKRIVVNGYGISFKKCFFDDLPLVPSKRDLDQVNAVTYENCFFKNNTYAGVRNGESKVGANQRFILAYDRLSWKATNASPALTTLSLDYNVTDEQVDIPITAGPVTIIDAVARTGSFVSDANSTPSMKIGDYVVSRAPVISTEAGNLGVVVIGRITAIDTGTSVINIDRIPPAITNGFDSTVTVLSIYRTLPPVPAMCDTVFGSSNLTNVIGWGGWDFVNGQRLYVSNVGWCLITGHNAGTRTIAVNRPAFGTGQRQLMCDYEFRATYDSSSLPNHASLNVYDFSIPTGSRWIARPYTNHASDTRVREFFCKKGGYISPATIGAPVGLLAEFIEINPLFETSGTGSFQWDITPVGGLLIDGFIVESTAGDTINIGTTNGGSEIIAGMVLTANTPEVISASFFIRALKSFYFSGAAGTLSVKAIVRTL